MSTEHPEDYCQQCHRENVVWFTPNALWNTVENVLTDKGTILCPICFIQHAEIQGLNKSSWLVTTEDVYKDLHAENTALQERISALEKVAEAAEDVFENDMIANTSREVALGTALRAAGYLGGGE